MISKYGIYIMQFGNKEKVSQRSLVNIKMILFNETKYFMSL